MHRGVRTAIAEVSVRFSKDSIDVAFKQKNITFRKFKFSEADVVCLIHCSETPTVNHLENLPGTATIAHPTSSYTKLKVYIARTTPNGRYNLLWNVVLDRRKTFVYSRGFCGI